MLGRDVIEGEQRFSIFGQAAGGLGVLRLVLGEEAIERCLGIGPARRLIDGAEAGTAPTSTSRQARSISTYAAIVISSAAPLAARSAAPWARRSAKGMTEPSQRLVGP